MLEKIDGLSYASILESGIKNLAKNKKVLNDLNVFPVPDGDTGTNMVMTLRHGYNAIENSSESISDISGQFASSAVFGARGNSGVIVSQFVKGMAESFKGKEYADCETFINALEMGYQFAYQAVVNPVEGTMLTVLREAAEAVRKAAPFKTIEEILDVYLEEAQKSLQRTPELLPVLKKAGVVDSGGSGVVCFFEGVKMYLDGEEIQMEEEIAVSEYIDLSKFNKDTQFIYGYCIEGLLQLKMDVYEFDKEDLKKTLNDLGGSIVMTLEGDKVKLHIHSKTPGKVINCCQAYGEFLTIKIENMTVQNLSKGEDEIAEKFLYSEEDTDFDFAVVAAVPNAFLQKKFFEMGADVVIMSEIAPSAQDFIDAFECTNAKEILVFPNSSNSILTSMHAGSLYKKARVTVLNSRSIQECYLSLGLIDFEEGIDQAVDTINEALSNLYQVAIYQALKDIKYGAQKVSKNEFFSLSNKKILANGSALEGVVLDTIGGVLETKDCSVLTLFYGAEVAEEFIEALEETIREKYSLLEITAVATKETICDIVLAFE